MDLLIDLDNRSYHDFYESIINLNLLGMGSVKDILDMSIVDIEEMKQIMRSDEMLKARYKLLGIPVKD